MVRLVMAVLFMFIMVATFPAVTTVHLIPSVCPRNRRQTELVRLGGE